MVKTGLEDVIATESTICFVDGTTGRFIYQGYDIHDLAKYSCFAEVVYKDKGIPAIGSTSPAPPGSTPKLKHGSTS